MASEPEGPITPVNSLVRALDHRGAIEKERRNVDGNQKQRRDRENCVIGKRRGQGKGFRV
jgi:hypothetical protein